jgi:hypothetical protein
MLFLPVKMPRAHLEESAAHGSDRSRALEHVAARAERVPVKRLALRCRWRMLGVSKG